jgi:hypothetical protein
MFSQDKLCLYKTDWRIDYKGEYWIKIARWKLFERDPDRKHIKKPYRVTCLLGSVDNGTTRKLIHLTITSDTFHPKNLETVFGHQPVLIYPSCRSPSVDLRFPFLSIPPIW